MLEKESLILKPIPMDSRIGWRAPLFNILGTNVAISALMVGGTLIGGMTFKQMLAVSIMGNLILALIMFIQGYIGAREGLNTYVLATGAFGENGGKWVISLILGITSFGWFGIQAGVAGLSVQKIFPGANLTITIIILGILMFVIAGLGFKAMALFNYIAIPPLLILIIWGLVKGIGAADAGESIFDYVPLASIGMTEGINMVVGMIIVGAVISPDYLRYTRGAKDIIIIALLGIALITVFQQVSAGVMAMQAPSWDITEVLSNLGFNSIAFVILLLAAWSTNLANAYSGGLALKNIFPNVKRNNLTYIAGIIGTIVAASGIIFKFQDFLGLLSSTVSPIAGIMWVEYYILQKRKFVVRKNVNWIAMVSWILGSIITYFTGVWGIGLSPINGIIIAGILYYVLMKGASRK